MKIKHFIMVIMVFTAFFWGCKSENHDAAIQTAVTGNLSNRPTISATVKDGIVTLTGECPDKDCRSNSEDAVKKIDHVKKVVNNITIVVASSNTTNSNNSPAQISADENLINSVSDVIKNYNGVQASVDHGVITLRGEIKRSNLQELIIKLNDLNPKQVINELAIK